MRQGDGLRGKLEKVHRAAHFNLSMHAEVEATAKLSDFLASSTLKKTIGGIRFYGPLEWGATAECLKRGGCMTYCISMQFILPY